MDTSDKSAAQIERDLGIGAGCFSCWKRELALEGGGVKIHSVAGFVWSEFGKKLSNALDHPSRALRQCDIYPIRR